MIDTLRDLNLSYNRINSVARNAEDYEGSINFTNNMVKFMISSKMINHMNLSGMNFD